MKAVILAAGQGKRMGDLSTQLPKVMHHVNGKPLLERILLNLSGKVDEVIMVVGFKKEVIMNYFNESFKGLKIRYVIQDSQLGTAHALGLVKSLVNGRFLLIYGDLYYSHSIIDKLLSNPCAGVMAVKEVTNPCEFGVVELAHGRIVRIHEKVLNPPSNLVNAGIYLLPDEIFKAIELTELSKRGEYELTDSIQLLIDKGWFFGFEKVKEWIDVGTKERLNQANHIN